MRGQGLSARAEGVLRAAGILDAEADAAWLLSHVLGVSRAGALYADVPGEKAEAYIALVNRRAAGEPLQHIIGTQPFLGLEIRCDPRALIPRPETEELAAFCVDALKSRPGRFLDLCTGSGALALAIAHGANAEGDASDISGDALCLARENADALGLSSRVRFFQGDLFDALPDERYALIVSNPPYIPTGDIASLAAEVRDREPRLALDGGADGLWFYRRIAAKARARLLPGGTLALEAGDGQAGAVLEMLAAPFAERGFVRDIRGIPRIVWARRDGRAD